MIPGATLWLAHACVWAHLALIFWAVYLDRPGYLSTLDTPEAVDVTKALVGSPVVVGNARQYDVWVAACTQGRNVTAPTVTADALQAAIRGALTGLIGGAK